MSNIQKTGTKIQKIFYFTEKSKCFLNLYEKYLYLCNVKEQNYKL